MAPMVTLMVEQKCGKFDLPQLSDSEEGEVLDAETISSRSKAIRCLVDLANILATRFLSARDMWALLQDVDHLLCCNAATVGISNLKTLTTKDGRMPSSSWQDFSDLERSSAMDLDLLNKATIFIDRQMAIDDTSYS
jgi:hypothetical protein